MNALLAVMQLKRLDGGGYGRGDEDAGDDQAGKGDGDREEKAQRRAGPEIDIANRGGGDEGVLGGFARSPAFATTDNQSLWTDEVDKQFGQGSQQEEV